LEKPSKIILGIDPGTLVMGYGIIEIVNGKISILEMNALKLSSKKHAYERLEMIYRRVCELIVQHKPDMFAIEAPFFGKNVQSMLKLGRAQGVAIAAAMQATLPVFEYSPKKIKQSITGNGNADKEQVWKMIQRLTPIKEQPSSFDATDALAVAICHHFQSHAVLVPGLKKVKGWEEFVSRNAARVRD
jgi:crossover junction endodeoxyribonuclease RuvC